MEKNLYVHELAKLAGVTKESVASIERDIRGKKRGLRPATVRKLAEALNKPIWYIGCYDKLPEDTFGQKLKKARLYHGHTLEEAAKYLGVDENCALQVQGAQVA